MTHIAMTLSRDEAQNIAVAAQHLDRRPRGRITKAQIRALVDQLGCIQLDTISVITRSHETVVWSRLGGYDRSLLTELHFPDGYLMEYWAHAAALVPTSFFPLFRRAMDRYREQHAWARENRALLDEVLARVRDTGPVRSSDFVRPDDARPAAWDWWGGKPDRRALAALWTMGELMVLKREGFQRTYELTERLLPDAHSEPLPPLEEQHVAFAQVALTALGVSTPRWIADYFRTGGRPYVSPAEAKQALNILASRGQAIPVEVEGISNPSWLAAERMPMLDDLRAGRRKPTLTTLLSPFDNLIWFRPRTAELFGFDYRLECYTPAQNRRYGYYSLPILHQGRLVGRLDPSYNRKNHVLSVKSLHLEPRVRESGSMVRAIAWAIRDLATFLGANNITMAATDPPALVRQLQRDL